MPCPRRELKTKLNITYPLCKFRLSIKYTPMLLSPDAETAIFDNRIETQHECNEEQTGILSETSIYKKEERRTLRKKQSYYNTNEPPHSIPPEGSVPSSTACYRRRPSSQLLVIVPVHSYMYAR
jgi:hypothetical protein